MIGRIGAISHHLLSFLGAIELTVSYVHSCISMLKLRSLYHTSREFDLLTSLGSRNLLLT